MLRTRLRPPLPSSGRDTTVRRNGGCCNGSVQLVHPCVVVLQLPEPDPRQRRLAEQKPGQGGSGIRCRVISQGPFFRCIRPGRGGRGADFRGSCYNEACHVGGERKKIDTPIFVFEPRTRGEGYTKTNKNRGTRGYTKKKNRHPAFFLIPRMGEGTSIIKPKPSNKS